MKALIVIAILALLVVAGCAPAAPTAEKTAAKTVTTDAAVAEATSGIVDSNDNVEIGEVV